MAMSTDERSAAWPRHFLWGAATSAHQVEGDNTTSDWWHYETMPSSPLPEQSAQGCGSLHRWADDMQLRQSAGLNSYRFGIEWARIEPERGQISAEALNHYAAMIAGARARGLHPIVTAHHFTHPAWFAARGGWLHPDAVGDFARYIRVIAPVMREAAAVVTINEPNMVAIMHRVLRGEVDLTMGLGGALPLPHSGVADALIAAHRAAVAEIRATAPTLPTGWSVANQVVRAMPGGENHAALYRDSIEDMFVRAAANDDFLGVQAYTRTVFGPDGRLPAHHAGGAVTATGWEFYPTAVGEAIDDVREIAPDLDLLVTENGIATDDDAQRIEYLEGALASLAARADTGSRIRSYLHWSLLDNYEWGSWQPRFGLAEVDRDGDFARTAKPSLTWLGRHARTPSDSTKKEESAL